MPISRQETGLSLSRLPGIQTQTGGGPVRYRGNCHCAKNRFEVTLPEITRAISCDCSLCHKSGYLWAFPEPGDIKYTKGGAETLTGFETEALSHEVCTSSSEVSNCRSPWLMSIEVLFYLRNRPLRYS